MFSTPDCELNLTEKSFLEFSVTVFSGKGTKSNLLASFFQHFCICFAMDKDTFCDQAKSFNLSILGGVDEGRCYRHLQWHQQHGLFSFFIAVFSPCFKKKKVLLQTAKPGKK